MSLHKTEIFEPIGFLKSPFTEKFGVPRQSLMMSEARGILKLNPDPRFRDALRTLEQFSHVWLLFSFHQHSKEEWTPLITPPRIDAPRKVGVFASRSPHRPNNIGLSAVKLEKIDFDAKNGIEIHFSGIDLLDGTPIFDIKPYVPYVDCIPEAKPGWTESLIPTFQVHFSNEAEVILAAHADPHLKKLIEQMLSLDPRPTSQRRTMPISDPKQEGAAFAFRILDVDVKWEIRNGTVWVQTIIYE